MQRVAAQNKDKYIDLSRFGMKQRHKGLEMCRVGQTETGRESHVQRGRCSHRLSRDDVVVSKIT